MKRGLIVGKFYPFHLGHDYLIRLAKAQCDQLIVLVLASDSETIPVWERERWIKAQHPDVIVRSGYDNVPTDYEDGSVWDCHVEIFSSMLKENIDVLFSSEIYGYELAERMGIGRHKAIDIPRGHFRISGTEIRQSLVGNWDHLTPGAKAWLCKRIVVLGAESTGTTTLANALGAKFGTGSVPEFGRAYTEAKIDPWTNFDFTHIAVVQSRLEDKWAAAGTCRNGILICDTDALATQVFQEVYMGESRATVRHIASQRPPSLYVLTDHEGIPFEQDGTREHEAQRPWMTARFEELLARQPAPWIKVTGRPESRVEQALNTIQALPEFYFGPTI